MHSFVSMQIALHLILICMQIRRITSSSSNQHNYNNITGCQVDESKKPGSGTIDGYRLICVDFDRLSSFPSIPSQLAKSILSIYIKNQPRLTALHRHELIGLKRLRKLSILDCGLTSIERETFLKNTNLERLDLRGNRLSILDWRSMVGLIRAGLDVRRNPLACNCANYWLAVWNRRVAKRRQIQAPNGADFELSTAYLLNLPFDIVDVDELECEMENATMLPAAGRYTSTAASIRDWALSNTEYSSDANSESPCRLPSVRMSPASIRINDLEDGASPRSIDFTCTIESSRPLDEEFRETILLKIVDSNETRSRFRTERAYDESNGRLTVRISSTIGGDGDEDASNSIDGLMGWYICLGSSDAGPQFDLAWVAVESVPRIKAYSNNGEGDVGQIREKIEFTIIAFPPIDRLVWYKNGRPLDLLNDDRYSTVFTLTREDERAKKKRAALFYVEKFSLIVQLIFTYEFYRGDYELEVCNSRGCDRRQFASYHNESWFNNQIHQRILIGPTIVANPAESPSPDSQQGRVFNSEWIWIIAVACTSCGLVLCGLGFVYRWIRSRKPDWFPPAARCSRHPSTSTTRSSFPLSTYTTNTVYEPLLSTGVPVVPMASLEIAEPLGEGAFGQVYLAYCYLSSANISSSSSSNQPASPGGTDKDTVDKKPTAVAAKKLKSFSSTECSQEFVREAEFMAKLNHPNVVTFYGVCLSGKTGQDLLLLYEYMDRGDLKRFLAQHGPHPELMIDDSNARTSNETAWLLTAEQQIDIARQVATGLSYLHHNHFVHRDLAARNCLVNSNLIVKLSDFGMSRDIYSSDYYRLTHKAPLPVRWLPPEALCYGRFSDMSDVWSFGVVVWEIAAYGEQPWRGYSNLEVMQKVGLGEMLEPPPECAEVLRAVMVECWRRTPCERVKLDVILERLRNDG